MNLGFSFRRPLAGALALAALFALAPRGASAQTIVSEDFEAFTFGSFASGWYIQQVGGTPGNDWALTPVNPLSGTMSMLHNDFSGLHDNWIVSPSIDISGAVAPELSFLEDVDTFSCCPAINQEVLIIDAGTFAADSLFTGDVTLGTWTTLANDTADSGGARTTVLPIDEMTFTGNIRIAFRYEGDFDAEWRIDDFEVRDVPAAPAITLTSTDVDSLAPVTSTFFYQVVAENTGSVAGTYSIGTTSGSWTTGFFDADQTTPAPAFPATFGLMPGETRVIEIGVNAPFLTVNGDMDTETLVVTETTTFATDNISFTSTAANLNVGDTVLNGPENFEATAAGFPPAGWVQEDVGGFGASDGFFWDYSDGAATAGERRAHTGTSSAFFNDFNTPTPGDNEVWLISPAYDLSGASGVPTLRYWENRQFTPTLHEVLASTTYDGGNFDGTIGTSGEQWQSLSTANGVANTWTMIDLSLAGHVSSATYVAFRYIGDFDSEWWIDDVAIIDAPGTPDVTVTQVDADMNAAPGATVFYTVDVENTGNVPDTFTAAAATGAWTDGFFESDQSTALTNPFMLNPGEIKTIEVSVTVPGGAADLDMDSETVDISGGMGSSDSATITTTAFDVTGGYFEASSFDTGAPSFPSFNFVDISGTGTDELPNLDDDNIIGPFSDLPAGFTFFGASPTQYWISSNGWISFTDPATQNDGVNASEARTNNTLPNATEPNDMVAFYWDDLDPDDVSVTGKAAYRGQDGNGNLVVSFERYPRFSADADGYFTSQAILRADGNIRVQIQELGATLTANSATIGIENATGTRGLTYRANATGDPITPTPMAVEFGTNQLILPVELSAFGLE